MTSTRISFEGGKADIMKMFLCYMIVLLHVGHIKILSPLLRCAVPLFFMLSSYFFFKKYIKVDISERTAILKRYVKRNLQLYLFWTLLLLPFLLWYRDWFNDGGLVGILRLIRSILFSGTFPASWYIIASVWGTIIVCWLEKKCSKSVLYAIAIVSYVYSVVTSNYGLIVLENHSFFIVYSFLKSLFSTPYNSFFVSLIWILMGRELALLSTESIYLKTSFLRVGLFISFILLVVEFVVVQHLNCAIVDDCYFFLVPFCYLLLLLIGKTSYSSPSNLLYRKISTITYCSHMTISIILSILIDNWFNVQSWCLIFFLTVMFCLFLSFFFSLLEVKKGFFWLRFSY